MPEIIPGQHYVIQPVTAGEQELVFVTKVEPNEYGLTVEVQFVEADQFVGGSTLPLAEAVAAGWLPPAGPLMANAMMQLAERVVSLTASRNAARAEVTEKSSLS